MWNMEQQSLTSIDVLYLQRCMLAFGTGTVSLISCMSFLKAFKLLAPVYQNWVTWEALLFLFKTVPIWRVSCSSISLQVEGGLIHYSVNCHLVFLSFLGNHSFRLFFLLQIPSSCVSIKCPHFSTEDAYFKDCMPRFINPECRQWEQKGCTFQKRACALLSYFTAVGDK